MANVYQKGEWIYNTFTTPTGTETYKIKAEKTDECWIRIENGQLVTTHYTIKKGRGKNENTHSNRK
ncbi:MAG: hypothetical protein ACRDD4_10935 [Culicoidibacterales bacterium]